MNAGGIALDKFGRNGSFERRNDLDFITDLSA